MQCNFAGRQFVRGFVEAVPTVRSEILLDGKRKHNVIACYGGMRLTARR